MPPPPPPPVNVPLPPTANVAITPPQGADTPGRDDLLASIRKGNKLKKVPETEKKESKLDAGKVVDPNAPKKPNSGGSNNAPPKPAVYVYYNEYLSILILLITMMII